MLASEWHVGQLFFTVLWLALFVVWVWLIIAVFIDVFASPDISGPAKALWVLFLIIAPFLGVVVYLIARGHRMSAVQTRFGMPTRKAPARAVLTRDQVDALDRLNAERDQKLVSAAEYRERRADILA